MFNPPSPSPLAIAHPATPWFRRERDVAGSSPAFGGGVERSRFPPGIPSFSWRLVASRAGQAKPGILPTIPFPGMPEFCGAGCHFGPNLFREAGDFEWHAFFPIDALFGLPLAVGNCTEDRRVRNDSRANQTCLVLRGGDGREGEDGEQAVLGGGLRGGGRAGRLRRRLQYLPRRLLRQQPFHGPHIRRPRQILWLLLTDALIRPLMFVGAGVCSLQMTNCKHDYHLQCILEW